jgi:hypothetical protein
LPKASSESVVAIHYDSVHEALPAVREKFVQRRPLLTRAADPLIDVLIRDGESSALAVVA